MRKDEPGEDGLARGQGRPAVEGADHQEGHRIMPQGGRRDVVGIVKVKQGRCYLFHA